MDDLAAMTPEQLAAHVWSSRKRYRSDPVRCDCGGKEPRPFAVVFHLPGGRSALWVAGERTNDGHRFLPRAYFLFADRPPIVDQTRAAPCGHTWAVLFDPRIGEVRFHRLKRHGRTVVVD